MALYDVAHLCSWNGYAEDMRSYLGVDKAAWTNKEFWFPFGANILYGLKKKSRIQRICEEMAHGYDGKNYYHHCLMRSYDPVARIRQLLADGAKPDIKDADGWSPLLVCSRNGFEGHLEIAKLLLDAGADINQMDHVYTPLHYASSNGNMTIVRELLRRGANVHISTDQPGTTPIGFAAQHGHLEIVKELVKAGAIVDAEIFKRAILGDNVAVVKYLLTLIPPPADSVYHAVQYKTPRLIRALAKAGADMNFRFPLHNAINSMDHSSVAELCASGANVNLLDQNNESPLCIAIIAANPEAIKTLTKYKANVSEIVRDEPLLHYAIGMYDAVHEDKKQRKMCVLAIIEAGPNFKLLDIWGNTAAESATEKNIPDILIQIKRAEMKQRFHAKGQKGKR
jgi:ankyrin repeat protein